MRRRKGYAAGGEGASRSAYPLVRLRVGERLRAGARWRLGGGVLGILSVVGLAAVDLGCDPGQLGGPATAGSTHSAAAAAGSSGRAASSGTRPLLGAPLPHEAWRPGYALVELQPEAPTPLVAPAASSPPAAALAIPDGDLLGGVRVQALREVIPGDPARHLGPIVLFALPDAPDAATTRALLTPIAGDPRVARVEPDRLRHSAALPNDPLLPQQWSLPMIHLPAAWAVTQGSPAVVVAVLDTGILYGHPDLESRLVAGYDFLSNPATAADGDSTRDADPTDTGTIDSSRLHGTHVAGTIGAVTNNGLGIAGIDQKCRLMPVRVLGVNGGDGIDTDIADAVRWASGAPVGNLPLTPTPAHFINMSFGGPGVSFTLQRAIDDALGRGVVVIAAAGNGGDDAATYSPGGLDGVITIGAVGRDGVRASYSNYGPRVDLLAPGGDFTGLGDTPDLLAVDMQGSPPEGILSTYRDEGIAEPTAPPFTYDTLIGTSQAAPHVTGAAALVKAILPAAGPRTIGLLLSVSADGSYRCPASELGGCGAGLLDVEQLVHLATVQARCHCTGDQYCDQGTCSDPPLAHPSLYDRPVIHGGWCGIAGPHPAGPPVGYALFAAVALARTQRRRPAGKRQRNPYEP